MEIFKGLKGREKIKRMKARLKEMFCDDALSLEEKKKYGDAYLEAAYDEGKK